MLFSFLVIQLLILKIFIFIHLKIQNNEVNILSAHLNRRIMNKKNQVKNL